MTQAERLRTRAVQVPANAPSNGILDMQSGSHRGTANDDHCTRRFVDATLCQTPVFLKAAPTPPVMLSVRHRDASLDHGFCITVRYLLVVDAGARAFDGHGMSVPGSLRRIPMLLIQSTLASGVRGALLGEALCQNGTRADNSSAFMCSESRPSGAERRASGARMTPERRPSNTRATPERHHAARPVTKRSHEQMSPPPPRGYRENAAQHASSVELAAKWSISGKLGRHGHTWAHSGPHASQTSHEAWSTSPQFCSRSPQHWPKYCKFGQDRPELVKSASWAKLPAPSVRQ